MADQIGNNKRTLEISHKNMRVIRILIQLVSIIFLVVVLIIAHQGDTSSNLHKFPVWLSPLGMLAKFLSQPGWNQGLWVTIIILVSAFLFGRAWCGWICPLGTLIDIFAWKRKNRKQEPPNENWRKVKYVLLFVIFSAAILGNLSLIILDPMTIFIRSISSAVLPGMDQLAWLIETSLYRIPSLREIVAQFDSLIRPAIFPLQPQYYSSAGWIFLFLVFILALNFIAERFWCRYLCPLGGLLGLISKISLFKREVRSHCVQCNRCARACPTGTINNREDFASDPSECIWCMDCLAACPNESNVFSIKLIPARWEKYDPERREVISSIAIGAATALILKSEPSNNVDSTMQLRPPGVLHQEFLESCIRCGECVRVCPTTALQPALLETGIQGFWSPILVPRLGYCDFSCNSCGAICPVGAIPALPLDEKRTWKIGSAYIDQDRCLAWSDGIDCIVCEEMCPLPQKAITLRDGKGRQSLHQGNQVLLPEVNRDLCIGCGICEYKCPVVGNAAIQVFPPQVLS